LLITTIGHGQNGLLWTTNFYLVTGTTLGEIRASLDRSRPSTEIGKMDGFTAWQIDWQFTSERYGSGCRCRFFSTRTTITTTLPRWTSPTNTASSVKESWASYIAALGQHEAGHAQLALAAAREVQERIKEVGEASDCESLKIKINDIGQRIVEEYKKHEQDYDRRTRHGVTQGSLLSRNPRPGSRGPD
jgi:predicted secreted Zn-dependent protease